jgi:hypothetical protein
MMRPTLYVLLGVLLVPTVGLVGDIVTDGKFKSTTGLGAPLEVESTKMVLNLNADMVDGIEGTDLTTVADVETIVSAAIAGAEPRKYYISDTEYSADDALTACTTGYHFASIFEILEPSHLKYATSEADAQSRADSGEGPPTLSFGWIRTGFNSSGSTIPGYANCNTWASISSGARGTVVMLSSNWDDPTLSDTYNQVFGSPWYTYDALCNTTHSVWCVED